MHMQICMYIKKELTRRYKIRSSSTEVEVKEFTFWQELENSVEQIEFLLPFLSYKFCI